MLAPTPLVLVQFPNDRVQHFNTTGGPWTIHTDRSIPLPDDRLRSEAGFGRCGTACKAGRYSLLWVSGTGKGFLNIATDVESIPNFRFKLYFKSNKKVFFITFPSNVYSFVSFQAGKKNERRTAKSEEKHRRPARHRAGVEHECVPQRWAVRYQCGEAVPDDIGVWILKLACVCLPLVKLQFTRSLPGSG